MAKVYISSTVDDLAGEREAAMKWLVDIGHQPVHSYVPDANPVVASCLADVRSCDIYVLILGHRYGFQPPDDNPDRLSITHLEYRCAEGMPRIALLRTGTLRDRPTDPGDPDNLARVEAFREEVRKAVRPGEFSDAATFIAGLSTGLERALRQLAEKRGQWPQPIVEDLASRLDAEFEFHMRSGEDVSGEQARSRFVTGVLRVRRQEDGGEQTLDTILATAGSQLLVVGEGGSGKTTMLKQLAAAGAGRAAREPHAAVYIYLRLASFDRTDGGLDLLIDRLSIAARLERHDFERLWQRGPRPIVFLLDGLNEVALACQPSCTQALRTLLHHSPAHHSYVVTSRPGSELEALSSRSTEDERLRQADIVKFGPRQVREYLKAQGLAALGSRLSGRLESLASNPFLLWAITRTVARSSEGGPASRGALFTALLDRYVF